jgi:uncharacterized protein YjiS (DUF1127 family)
VEKRSFSGASAYPFRAAPSGAEIKHIAADFLIAHIRAPIAAWYSIALEWRRRARSRRQLRSLTPREIRDFCLDPMEAEREVNKPFWRA